MGRVLERHGEFTLPEAREIVRTGPTPSVSRHGAGEWDFLAEIRAAGVAGSGRGSGVLGIGDDAAVLAAPAGRVVASVDAMVDGVHFDLAFMTPEQVGWRATSGALSDLAAMGARADAVLVSLAWDSFDGALAVTRGAMAAGQEFDAAVVGGDTVAHHSRWVSVTALGSAAHGYVTRAGARVGDTVWVTGSCGGAARGLELLREHGQRLGGDAESSRFGGDADAAHAVQSFLRPQPRLTEGQSALGLGATAMVDVSDGLAHSLGLVASESQVGIVVDEVPVAPGAALGQALYGGEDFELVICFPATVDPSAQLPALRRVGVCVAELGVRWADTAADAGTAGQMIDTRGYEHRWEQ